MDELTRSALSGIAALPPRIAFDEVGLWEVLRGLGASREGAERAEGPFARLSQAQLHTALVAAADSGLVREVELRPGGFLVVRTNLAGAGIDRSEARFDGLSGRLESLIRQPSAEDLQVALAVLPDTVALRHAVLDPNFFVLPVEEYAALLNAAASDTGTGL